MENKKTKLTISGSSKKSYKNLDNVKSQGKKTVIIEKKSVRDKVNGEISALHRGAYKAACYYLRDDHPELYEEIEEDIDAFHNSTKAVERETRINLRSQKFNIK